MFSTVAPGSIISLDLKSGMQIGDWPQRKITEEWTPATEAWSRGLPVITTDRAGAADLLKPHRNGLLIPAGDPAAIVACIEWCLTHRAELHAMREESLATAAGWQWSDYRRTLVSVLRDAGIFPRP